MSRVLVCGDRNYNNYSKILENLKVFPAGTVIIHGDCRGADKIAGSVAKKLNMEVLVFPADWNRYGKSAGPIRNKRMLEEGKPDIVIAFHENIDSSKGTKNNELGLDVILIEE